MSFIDTLKYDERGLIPAIIQDAENGEVLMFAFTNSTALKKTLETGLMHFYSRSRNKLWMKGEESGHTQKVVEMRVDCDTDALLIKVKQKGGACHTGFRSCFYRKVEPLAVDTDKYTEDGKKLFNPEDVYKGKKKKAR